jgi:hypothetical protein
MSNIQIIFPQLKMNSKKEIKLFLKKKNKLIDLKIIDIVDALNFLSEYWVSNKMKIRNEFINNSLGYIIPWLKKSNSLKLLNLNFKNYQMLDEPYKDEKYNNFLYARPNGVTLHWMTGNVPVITLISLFQSILTKNRNIVKISRNYKSLFENIFEDIHKANIPNKFKKNIKTILNSIMIVYVDHSDKDSIEWLSRTADTRIIWGGFDAVSNLLSLPKKISCKDIVFGPKVSLCYASKKMLDKSANLNNFFESLTNDIFNFDQLGCNSPHNLFIQKGSKISTQEITNNLKYFFSNRIKQIKNSLDPVNKYNFLNEKFKYDLKKNFKIISDQGYNWNIIINSEKFPRAEDPLYNRSIFISEIKDYNYLKKILPENIQTVGLFVEDEEKKKIIKSLSDNGPERFPNIGSMSNYSHPWDGYLPMQSLVRWVSSV